MSESEDEWQFSLEDLQEGDEEDGNVAGSFLPDEAIEPEAVSLENAVFVLLGVLLSGVVLVGFVLALT
jgi:hypothetical protein